MNKQILIVDDSKTFLMYIGLLLRRLEYSVIPAENGLEALKLLKLIEPDIVMLDVNMELIDGFKVLQHIKSDKQTSNIPVIIVSTDSSNQTIKKCKELGCYDYLLKPVKIDELHRLLQKCLFSRLGMDRKHLRIHFNEEVVINYDGKQSKLFSETLSEGGIYVITKEPHPVGRELEVIIPLKESISIHTKGIVIYKKELFGGAFKLPPGMAIEFKGLTEVDSETLKSYIIELLSEGIIENQDETII